MVGGDFPGMSEQRGFPPALLAWTVWGLGALLYLIGFYQRVAPAVITDQLMTEFMIGGAALGNMSAFYFYSYVAMQIPTGMIADRWGPRRLLTVGAGVAALGTALFAIAPNIFWANMGRLLIGASVAVAFVSMLKLASHWFAPKQYALASGMALLMGVVGGVVAGGAAALSGGVLRLAAGDGRLGGGHRRALRRDLAARARRSGRARLCQPLPGRAWRARGGHRCGAA
jgi:MFS family permease